MQATPTGQPNNPTAVKYPYATSGPTLIPARSPRDISYAHVRQVLSTDPCESIPTSLPDLILHNVPHRPPAQNTSQYMPHIQPQALLRSRCITRPTVRYRLQTVDVSACYLAFQSAHRKIPNRRMPLRNAIRSDPRDVKFPARLRLARDMVGQYSIPEGVRTHLYQLVVLHLRRSTSTHSLLLKLVLHLREPLHHVMRLIF
jgi:hypothetical protein